LCVLGIIIASPALTAMPLATGAVQQSDGAVDAAANEIVVNGKTLSDKEITTLIGLYGQAYVGRYWYDPVSGL